MAFADDMTMIFRGATLDHCISRAQVALDMFEKWTEDSCMLVNVQKTFGLAFTIRKSDMKQDKITSTLTYKGQQIRIYSPNDPPETALTFDASRLLGVHLDHNGSFFRQISKIKDGVDKAKQCMSVLSGQSLGANTKELVGIPQDLFPLQRALRFRDVLGPTLKVEPEKDRVDGSREPSTGHRPDARYKEGKSVLRDRRKTDRN